jgi:hypothetical protein
VVEHLAAVSRHDEPVAHEDLAPLAHGVVDSVELGLGDGLIDHCQCLIALKMIVKFAGN